MTLQSNIVALRRDIEHKNPPRQHILTRHLDEPEEPVIAAYEAEHGKIKKGEQVVMLIKFGEQDYGTT